MDSEGTTSDTTDTTRAEERKCEPGYYCLGGLRSVCDPGSWGLGGEVTSSCSGLCSPGECAREREREREIDVNFFCVDHTAEFFILLYFSCFLIFIPGIIW